MNNISAIVESIAYVNVISWLILSFFGAPKGEPYNKWDRAALMIWTPCMFAIAAVGVAKALMFLIWR